MAHWPQTQEEITAVERFRTEVCERSSEVDPSEELDWYSLSLGFFIACGLTPDIATDMAIHVRYDLGYWQDKNVQSE